MYDADDTKLPVSRRGVLQGVGGIGATTVLSGSAVASGDPGGGGGDDGPPSDGDGGDGDDGVATVTLITGQTVQVRERRGQREYVVDSDDDEVIRSFEADEGANLPAGTYVVPTDADLTTLDPMLFNVDLLVDQKVTDEETDAIPVVLELGESDGLTASSATASGFSQSRELPSIGAVAGEVAKDRDRVAARDVTATSAIDHVHLDTLHEALLDTSADAVNASAAREEYDVDASGVSVAILDTGIDADHPDFGDRVVYEADFSGDGVADGNGHGTHCAGIAAGAGEANDEYVGMAPGADLMNVKVLGNGGSGRLSDIVAGIEHATAQEADVISMSLGGPTQQDGPMVQAVEAAVDEGVVATVAAGNNGGHQSLGSPGIAEAALTVGASDEDGAIPYFSSGGPTPYDYRVKPELLAPGTAITAAGSDDAGEYPYADKSGTSMSTPHVAGIAALLLEDDPGLTPDGVKSALVATADPLDGPDVFMQGGGVVDAAAALGANLRVRDPVTSFGLFESNATETASVTVENAGDESLELDVSATLTNVQSGDSLDDNVAVTPSTVTVAPGATESVEFSVETSDAFGFNSGALTFETANGESYRGIFGFVRGTEITVEKVAHEDSEGVAGDDLYAYAHDGSTSHTAFGAFDASGEYSFVSLSDGGEFLFWSPGELAAGDRAGEPTLTATSGVEVDPDGTTVTLDESETVPRDLDTGRVSEHEPLAMQRFDATLYANIDGGPAISAATSFVGDQGVRNAHVTPVEESDPTNVGASYLMSSETDDAEYPLDSPTGYHLFYGALSVDGPRDVITVDPADLTTEEFEFHRTYEGQLYGVSPTMYPADFEHFPTFFTVSFLTDVSDDRVEQTWYRNAQARYDESWYDEGSFSGAYMLDRVAPLAPEPGETYHQRFNADPLGNTLTDWTLDDGTLSLRGQWNTDQSEKPFTVFQYDDANVNTWSVSVDGETAASGESYYTVFENAEVSDVSPGSVVDVSLDGNVLVETSRETTTTTDYRVTYRSGTANVPPQVEAVDVAGATEFNRVAAGATVAFVEVDHDASGVHDFRAFYAPSGAVDDTPFGGESGWSEAEVVYDGGDLFGVALDTAGHEGSLELAVRAVDTDGNRVQTTTFDALTISSGADHGVSVDVKPDSINVGSNQNVPVRVEFPSGISADDLAADSLRFGDPEAVHSGGGASAWKTHQLGDGSLKAMFRAGDTEFAAGSSPAAGQLVGRLEDGTRVSGVDVIEDVTGR